MIEHMKRLGNRIGGMVRIAQTTLAANETTGTQSVQLAFNTLETRNNIPTIANYGFRSSPMIGANAVVLASSGNAGDSVVIGTHDPRYSPTGLLAGESKMHDAIGQFIWLDSTGIIHITASHKVQVVCDTEVDITAPTVNVNATTAVNVTTPTLTINADTAVNITTPTLTLNGALAVVGGPITLDGTPYTNP